MVTRKQCLLIFNVVAVNMSMFQSNQSCMYTVQYVINMLMFYFNKSCLYAKLNILLLLSCIDLTTVG